MGPSSQGGNIFFHKIRWPVRWVPAVRWRNNYIARNKEALHVRDQNDNATYTSTRWVLTVRNFLSCEDVDGGSQESGGRIVFLFFARTHFLACEDVAGGSQ